MKEKIVISTIEERLIKAETLISQLNEEVFVLQLVASMLMHSHPDGAQMYRWMCREANKLEESGADPARVAAIDALRDLFDALHASPVSPQSHQN